MELESEHSINGFHEIEERSNFCLNLQKTISSVYERDYLLRTCEGIQKICVSS